MTAARRRLLALAATLSVAQLALAQTAGSLLVLSKHDHTLAIINPNTLQVVARMPVGNDPHEVIASADGTRAWVSNYGFGAFHTLAVLDLQKHTALPSIDLGPLTGPHGLAFAGGKVWFTAEGAKAVGRFDPAANKVDWIMGTGQNRTHMIYVAPSLQRVVTTNVSSGTVDILDLGPVPAPAASHQTGTRNDWNATVIPVGHGSEGFDVSPDGHEIWVANAVDGTISVINAASKQVVATLQANAPGANRLKFTPDGRHVLVATLKSPGLVVLDARTRAVIKRLPIAQGAAGIVMQPDGARAFVACTPDNVVTVIDLATLTVAGHIQAGDEPDGMAWANTR